MIRLTFTLLLILRITNGVEVEVLDECPVPFSTSTELPLNEKCDCSGDWLGSFCSVCTSDESCEAAFGGPANDPEGLYINHRCGKDLIVSSTQPEFRTWCDVKNEAIVRQTNGPAFSDFFFDTAAGVGRLEVARYLEGAKYEWVKLFTCGGSDCSASVSEDGNLVEYSCVDVDCALTCEVDSTPECTNFLRVTVDTVGREGFILKCDKTTNSCELKERVLNLFFADVILSNCTTGSCIKDLAPKLDPIALNESDIAIGNLTDAMVGKNPYQVSVYCITIVLLALISIVAGCTLIFMVTISKHMKHSKSLTNAERTTESQKNEAKTITFHNISYQLKKGKQILDNVSGTAKSGEITAIMGPSGAGKTTIMEILSMRQMSGKFTGSIYANGEPVNSKLKREIGFVDQGDKLSTSLTVFENLLFSALLRLPQDMPINKKVSRVNSVIETLQLSHTTNTRIGSSGYRGISGGEKRRVSVGMEIVNNPTILFLDEPTSGLDAYNASILMRCLRKLAWNAGTTVITTIHQPRSNIFLKFDKLLVLHQGQSVYCGQITSLSPYLTSLGLPIPLDYNPADYLIDVLFDKKSSTSIDSIKSADDQMDGNILLDKVSKGDVYDNNVDLSQDDDCEINESNQMGKKGEQTPFNAENFLKSHLYSELIRDIESTKSVQAASMEESDREMKAVGDQSGLKLWTWQVLVLSSRNTLGLFRNPLLLAFHLGFSVYFALLLGVMYYDLDMTSLSSIQNRLGAFMLMAVFISFTSLSALPLFWLERSLYIHERSNRFYSTSAYFFSKAFSDIVPLRVIPALVLGIVAYAMLGLRSGSSHYIDFLLTLVYISCTAASINLILGILIKNIMTGIFTGIIAMIHFFMMTKLFINFDSATIRAVQVLNYVSYFNYGYEAMVQNELVGRVIEDFAVTSGDGVLEFLGFNISTLYTNMFILTWYFLITLSLAFFALKYCVKEAK